jgi:hypothetical protein
LAVYADLLYSSRASSRASITIAAVNTEYEAAINAVSGGRRREFSLHDRPLLQSAHGTVPFGCIPSHRRRRERKIVAET